MKRERAREAGVAADDVSQVPPGAVTALLLEVARSPEATPGEAWDAALRPGAVIGRFELVREIGRGGFGVVYEARDRELGRSVAFKAVRAGDRAPLREERLLREAEAAARLSHPNIVTLFDVGRAEHGPYLVLELLRGRTLGERLREGTLPAAEALRIAVEVSRALAHAHAHGVVHRDLTPGNVFLCDDGQVKVLDFGLARVFGQRSVHGGTPAFMAPEQWRGAPEDERTDVFALGVILHRMIAGALPFPGAEGAGAPASSPPAPLDVPERPALGPLVARMLAADPVLRPRDGAEVHAALLDVERGGSPSAAAVAASAPLPSGPPPARARSRWIFVGAALAAGVALAAAAALLLRRGEPAGGARVAVAVADFENQTGEAELNGLSGMLITSLEQSRRLSVLTRVRMLDVLRQLGKQDVVTVDEPLGRELARSAGVRALVLATIRRFDQLYAIELKVLDPQTSEYLFTLKEVGEGKRSVPAMIDRLSDETRSRLRETPAEVSASHVAVADATTASFEAWSHYFAGEQAKDLGHYDVAIAEYRRATEVDPSFALAHYRIAYLGEFAGVDAATRRERITAALQAVERVPEKERLLILAWKAHMDGRDAEAQALYGRAVAAYPEDKETLYMAADLQFHQDRWQESLPLFDRALALDPAWDPALLHAVEALLSLGRTDEAASRAQAWVDRSPGAAFALWALARARLAQGRFEEGEAVARRAVAVDRTLWSGSILVEALLLLERYDEAEALARDAVGEGAPSVFRGRALRSLALVLLYEGRRKEAVRTLEGLPSDTKHGRDVAGEMALLAALVGDAQPDRARDAAQQVAGSGRVPRLVPMLLAATGDLAGAAERARDLAQGPERALYEATLAARGGDLGAALSLVDPATRAPEPQLRALALWLAAHWALEAGRPAEVRAHLEAFRRIPSDIFRAFAYPRSLLEEARALERLGDRAGARRRVEHLLALWKRADPDLPLLAEARALRDRLGRASASQR